MSDTPLTDAAKMKCGFQAVPDSFLEFTRNLERENESRRIMQHECIFEIWKIKDKLQDKEKLKKMGVRL